ncbi:hypothetical protein Bhyg_16439 [Pseudolycoriella hygida]|uniref:Secreted protein n=1 Tax=Pseudolycoriella hygida TaxID=35572 RepID=A0A9Q0MHG9_9DIPT|nr:hypothetical protein Bhyg_16439 [Pseudolycoriella hygida]
MTGLHLSLPSFSLSRLFLLLVTLIGFLSCNVKKTVNVLLIGKIVCQWCAMSTETTKKVRQRRQKKARQRRKKLFRNEAK